MSSMSSMSSDNDDHHEESFDLSNNFLWEQLYPLLRTRVRHLVNRLTIPVWHGQEEDLIEDIVQETMRRTLERWRKGERG